MANHIISIEKQPLKEYAEKAYLDYAMYVILDRALPHLGDGLKPVQRRIIYAMSELGLKNTTKHKKSARTVGDVLGKYHPHGDLACYEAMVLMAQSFSFRYPLIDGQGNWGSTDDPKSFAAMRYTEAKLTSYAQVLLKELEQGTVEWQLNFDGTLKEPELLPARLPNVLLNGSSGIAVGMATDIPSHNLREVANACIHLLGDPKATLDDMMEYIPAPDFPTKAEIITPPEDIKMIYQKGHGSIRVRAAFQVEEGEIIVYALPYQTSGAKVLEQIAQQMHAKKLPMVVDLRDESDHENPTRLVIVPKSARVNTDEIMQHIFATTDLERSYRVNFNMIGIDGKPRVKSLLTILKEWLDFRKATVKKRLEFRLEKVLARLHILEGLLIAYLNIDEVIHIIRTEDKPKPILIKRFDLTDAQAEAILELKLRHLAKLEEIKIRSEQDELSKERDHIQQLLSSEKKLKKLIAQEIEDDAKQYGDERNSKLVKREEAKALRITELLPAELVTVVLSEKGWIRAAKGHDIESDKLNYRSGDKLLAFARGRSNQSAVILDSAGRSYSLPTHDLPSARSQGEPLTGRLKLPAEAKAVVVLMGEDVTHYLLASTMGYGFITTLGDLQCKNRAGKVVINLSQGASIIPPCSIEAVDEQLIAVVTNVGRLLIFPVKALPQLVRGKGNKIINIPSTRFKNKEEWMISVTILDKNENLLVYAGKRHLTLKPIDMTHYHGERGRRGNMLPKGFRLVNRLERERKK